MAHTDGKYAYILFYGMDYFTISIQPIKVKPTVRACTSPECR